VTGDYSRGAAGYWIESGEIALSRRGDHDRGNLQDMFPPHYGAVGSDVVPPRRPSAGSILLERMKMRGD
jgi:PmbA protein